MDLILTGRGTKITAAIREAAARKLGRLERLAPTVLRLELHVHDHRNPRLGGTHRLEAAFETPRRTFRATADASDIEAALDLIVEKLERQLRDDRGRRRARLLAGAGRVKSARAEPEPLEPGGRGRPQEEEAGDG